MSYIEPIDPTSGLATPKPELMLEMYAAGSLGAAMARQNATLANASKTAYIKQTLAKPMMKEAGKLTKRLAGLEKQILKVKDPKEREALMKDRDGVKARITELNEQAKAIGKNSSKVERIRRENRQLNTQNHVSRNYLAHTSPQLATFLGDYIGETDTLSQDMEESASKFAAPSGFLGFNFLGGTGGGPGMAA